VVTINSKPTTSKFAAVIWSLLSIPAIVTRTFADVADFVPAPLRAG
jgi:hypothetical protein